MNTTPCPQPPGEPFDGKPRVIVVKEDLEALEEKVALCLKLIDQADAVNTAATDNEVAATASFHEAIAYTIIDKQDEEIKQLRAELNQCREDLKMCAEACIHVQTLSLMRSEPYIPDYVKKEIEESLQKPIDNPRIQSLLKKDKANE